MLPMLRSRWRRWEIRRALIGSLGQIRNSGPRDWMEGLFEQIQRPPRRRNSDTAPAASKSAAVRVMAADSLSKVGDLIAIGPLKEVLNDPVPV